MKKLAMLCAATAIALSAIACNQTPPDTRDADATAIKANETQWTQDWAAKDADKIAAHYADDAVLMVPGGPSTSGKDAILASLKAMVADPALSLTFAASKMEVAKSSDVGWTQGSYQLTMTDPMSKQVIHDHGSYVTTYRKQADGSWKAVADIATSEVPMSMPMPAAAKTP
jgi:uncharacterized protein (TIGR02246 family)